MTTKLFVRALFISATAFLVGCVANPPPEIPFSHTNVSDNARVGLIIDELPEIDNSYPGADCLLCLATASAMNGSITDHFKTLDVGDTLEVSKELASSLKSQGYDVVLIEEPLNLDKLPKVSNENPMVPVRDYADFKNKWNIDYLLVVDVNFIGFQRPYASYVPTSDPTALVSGATYIVDLNLGLYSSYQSLEIHRFADGGVWDEPPAFPGLTNAFYQALEDAKDKLMSSYKSGVSVALSETNKAP